MSVLVKCSGDPRRKNTRPSTRESFKACPRLSQWHWIRHIVRRGKEEVLMKAGNKEKAEILDSLLAIDRWLEHRFSTKFEIPLVQK